MYIVVHPQGAEAKLPAANSAHSHPEAVSRHLGRFIGESSLGLGKHERSLVPDLGKFLERAMTKGAA